MKRSRNYPRLRHGGYVWRWLQNYWIWKPAPPCFIAIAVALYWLAEPLTFGAWLLEMAGASAGAWILGWQLARPEDFE
jgi:hypothetical protein